MIMAIIILCYYDKICVRDMNYIHCGMMNKFITPIIMKQMSIQTSTVDVWLWPEPGF